MILLGVTALNELFSKDREKALAYSKGIAIRLEIMARRHFLTKIFICVNK